MTSLFYQRVDVMDNVMNGAINEGIDEEAFYKEKREFERFTLKASGGVFFEDGKEFKGLFSDISVAGTFFESAGVDKDSVNQFVTINMGVRIKGEYYAMVSKCKIVRVTNAGVGMLFGKMDDNSKRIFHALMQELRDNLL